MKFVVHRRYRGLDAGGKPMNVPYGREYETIGDFIATPDGRGICFTTSETAHQFFARNDDGYGLERGKLTQAIMKALAQRDGGDDKQYQERWDRVWADPACQPYRRADDNDTWLWNHEFFNAEIDVLRHIAELVGVRERS